VRKALRDVFADELGEHVGVVAHGRPLRRWR
jgi:hypothetical protein